MRRGSIGTALATATAVSAVLCATMAAAGAAPLAVIRTPLAVSTHGKPTVVVRPAFSLPAGAQMLATSIRVYSGSRGIAAGRAVSLKVGNYTEISSVAYRNLVVTHPLVAVAGTVYQPSKYETVTCTVTSMGPTSALTNYPDGTSYELGTLTGSCTSPDFPGQVNSDFELWGYNDENPISSELIAPYDWSSQPPATYQATILFFGQDNPIITYVPTTVTSWSAPVTVTSPRRGLRVVK